VGRECTKPQPRSAFASGFDAVKPSINPSNL
jgi:hypothetical protein